MVGAIGTAPLTGSIGARLTGVDLGEEVPDEVAAQIRDAFARCYVLVLPSDHGVGPEEQTGLAALFGKPQPLAMFQFLGAMSPSITLTPGSVIADTEEESAPCADAWTTTSGHSWNEAI